MPLFIDVNPGDKFGSLVIMLETVNREPYQQSH